jgi:hypothetical protein
MRVERTYDRTHSGLGEMANNLRDIALSFPKIPSGLDSRREAESIHHLDRCL